MGGKIMAFNYRTIFWTEEERQALHQNFVVDHYLKQFNEETITAKQQATCGEPCVAVCKKMNGIYKKDYEPYQTMGPLCGIFDQRAAEKLNHHCDAMGFDAISGGGVLAWLMDLLDAKLLTREELGVTRLPRWDVAGFDLVNDSMHNAELGCELIDAILERRGILDFREGVRKWSRIHSREKGEALHDRLVYIAFSRRGWMVPNQYWVAGALAPMAIMGKYYMIYSYDFIPPRVLGRMCAERMKKELILDNLGICRFHRGWAEEMLPEVMGSLYDCKEEFLRAIDVLASRLHSRNSPIFWESKSNIDYLHTFLQTEKGGRPRAGHPGWGNGSKNLTGTGSRPPGSSGTRPSRVSTKACGNSSEMRLSRYTPLSRWPDNQVTTWRRRPKWAKTKRKREKREIMKRPVKS